MEAALLRGQGDLAGAEVRFRQLLQNRAARSLSAVDLSLCGYKARHNLAGIYRQQGRAAEAEAEWNAALTEKPDYGPAKFITVAGMNCMSRKTTRSRWKNWQIMRLGISLMAVEASVSARAVVSIAPRFRHGSASVAAGD